MAAISWMQSLAIERKYGPAPQRHPVEITGMTTEVDFDNSDFEDEGLDMASNEVPRSSQEGRGETTCDVDSHHMNLQAQRSE